MKYLLDLTRNNLASLPIMCHQMSERSFFFQGTQFPVCARCTGVMVGQVIAIAMIVTSGKNFGFLTCIFLTLPALIDWSIQQFLGIESRNYRRVFTGTLLGFGYIYFLFNLVIQLWHYVLLWK